ncbi:hypothetical protein DXV75_16580 [Alteromonas aestuariivivens]|uniref:Uncharacterized protein n=1 Tax=Alteromonas aestuariivivens TaxID=1938339 RepID=A0A3D8M2N3_9ALTE|nr:hypothetical protein [Alteromonas aestuariivivens]RDV23977.1 hypothetical protein DXV75_16580 [Alteromonas aestuariivivens]
MLEVRNIATPPDRTFSKCHYYSDYIELVALLASDDLVSDQDIYDRFYDSGVINEDENPIGTEDWIGSDYASEYTQRWNDRILQWFAILLSRVSSYGDNYPFEVTPNSIKLKEELTDQNKIYLGLLLASSNSYHNKQSLLSAIFEEISRLAMSAYLGGTSSVHRFGASGLQNNRYVGSLEDKMKRLAIDIDCEVTSRSHVFREGDNGDGGVDIVAWLPFPDDTCLSRTQIFLGQSATGKNWNTKQGSVARVKNYINIPDTSMNSLFVPYDMRDIERRYDEEGELTASIVFDRYRIMSLISDATSIWQIDRGSEFLATIEQAITFEEDLV